VRSSERFGSSIRGTADFIVAAIPAARNQQATDRLRTVDYRWAQSDAEKGAIVTAWVGRGLEDQRALASTYLDAYNCRLILEQLKKSR